MCECVGLGMSYKSVKKNPENITLGAWRGVVKN